MLDLHRQLNGCPGLSASSGRMTHDWYGTSFRLGNMRVLVLGIYESEKKAGAREVILGANEASAGSEGS